jgi:hypothetical protein
MYVVVFILGMSFGWFSIAVGRAMAETDKTKKDPTEVVCGEPGCSYRANTGDVDTNNRLIVQHLPAHYPPQAPRFYE